MAWRCAATGRPCRDQELAGRRRPAERPCPGARRQVPAVLGSAATGVAGGVIDITLGNVMSVLGEKGGVGVGNLLNAISLVLNRFVNHDNALVGPCRDRGRRADRQEPDAAGKPRHGQHLHAHRSGHRHDRHHDQLRARRGAVGALPDRHGARALGSPSFNAVRGSASDPPGMASTLGSRVSDLPGVGSLLPGRRWPAAAATTTEAALAASQYSPFPTFLAATAVSDRVEPRAVPLCRKRAYWRCWFRRAHMLSG